MPVNPDHIALNFILSTGRTGSTLLSTMLNMHTEIISVSEEPFAYNLYQKYKDKTDWSDAAISEFCYDFYLFSEGKLEPQFGKPEDLVTILKAYQHQLSGVKAIKLAYLAFFPLKDKSGVTTIVDKQLKFHSLLDSIVNYYPKSKFIVLYRDPRDNVLVKIRRGIKQRKNEGLLFYSKTWDYEYRTLRKKIGKLPAGAYMEVKYEDLVAQPEPVLQSVCRFLGLSYQEQMLQYDQQVKKDLQQQEASLGSTVKQHLSLLHEGLTQKPNTDKVGHWRLGFTEKEANMIWSVCGKTALDIGYKADGCKPVSYFTPAFIKQLLRFYIIKIIIPGIYYSLPFGITYLIKKMKYGKNFRNGKWQTKDFYKSTLPS
jgi:hypothetical protein